MDEARRSLCTREGWQSSFSLSTLSILNHPALTCPGIRGTTSHTTVLSYIEVLQCCSVRSHHKLAGGNYYGNA